MALLRKLISATLIESMIASVLILTLFVISSLIINNIIRNTLENNSHQVETRLNELQYIYLHNKIKLPYTERFDSWKIDMVPAQDVRSKKIFVEITATSLKSEKIVRKKRYYEIQG